MTRRTTKLIREGDYVIELDVELSDSPDGWGPYLSLTDAERLDEARAALRRVTWPRASGSAASIG
jgi:hypothetical protein